MHCRVGVSKAPRHSMLVLYACRCCMLTMFVAFFFGMNASITFGVRHLFFFDGVLRAGIEGAGG